VDIGKPDFVAIVAPSLFPAILKQYFITGNHTAGDSRRVPGVLAERG
jgi:hypothetical protein